ncbi:hypothetical protein P3T73_13770 [Kiritimatiellota bacterium B12222]|nr:hypothetical protein P3T73_13770 [Kiritimatiellota bacterium B12222]
MNTMKITLIYKLIFCIFSFCLYAEETVTVEYSPNEHSWTYTGLDRKEVCILGNVVLKNDVHTSAHFKIIYKNEVVVEAIKLPADKDARITIHKNARQYEGVYRGAPMVWVHVWDRALRPAPLPGEGFYVIDPDGHIRKPKPEERTVIWKQ